MADEPFALTAAPPVTEADYETIAAAVMETERGRWFLAEYARRNRNPDTQILLAALDRIEAAIHRGLETTGTEAAGAESLASLSVETTPALTITDAMKPDGAEAGKAGLPQNPANALENAAATIRAAIEHLQDVAWRLREQQYDDRFGDEIDAGTRDIAAACVTIEETAAAARWVTPPSAESEDNTEVDIWQDTPTESAAASGLPQESGLVSKSQQPANEIAWDVALPQESEEQPEPRLVVAATADETWDQSEYTRAFETEAAPVASLWQLAEETDKTQPVETVVSPAEPNESTQSALLNRKARDETVLDEMPEDESGTVLEADISQVIVAPPTTNRSMATAEALPDVVGDPQACAPPDVVAQAPDAPVVESAVAEAQSAVAGGPADVLPGPASAATPSVPPRRDPLAPIRAMSDEEKIALFS